MKKNHFYSYVSWSGAYFWWEHSNNKVYLSTLLRTLLPFWKWNILKILYLSEKVQLVEFSKSKARKLLLFGCNMMASLKSEFRLVFFKNTDLRWDISRTCHEKKTNSKGSETKSILRSEFDRFLKKGIFFVEKRGHDSLMISDLTLLLKKNLISFKLLRKINFS